MKKIYLKPEIKAVSIVLPKLLGESLIIPVNTEPEDPPIDTQEGVF